MGSFKVLAPSGHRVVWTHPVGETKTCNFLRTRQTASAVIKHRGPSRSCHEIGGGSRKILINSMVSTNTRLNSPSETSHSALVSSVEYLQTGAARSRNERHFRYQRRRHVSPRTSRLTSVPQKLTGPTPGPSYRFCWRGFCHGLEYDATRTVIAACSTVTTLRVQRSRLGVLPFHKYFTKSIPLRIPDGGNFCIGTRGLRYFTRRSGLKPYSELTDTSRWSSQPAGRESSCKMELYSAG